MTISSTTNRVSFTGNGVTTAFPVSFPFFSTADLVVIETTIATGAQTTKTLTTDYTITGTTDANGFYSSGGTVVANAAPSSSVTWTIYRDVSPVQTTQHVDNDPMSAASIDGPLDKLTCMVQRLIDRVTRALTQPDGDSASIGALPATVARANMFLAFDASGNPIAAAGTSANLTPVSSFFNTLLSAASAAVLRGLLGLGTSAILDTGTTANKVVVLDGSAKLPAVDGSNLTNLTAAIANVRGFVNRLRGHTFAAVFNGTSGNASTGTPGASNWATDGVLAGCAGATLGWARIASTFAAPLTVHALKLTGQASVTDAFIRFPLESFDAAPLAGRTCTFQMRFINGTGGSITPTITVKHPAAKDDWTTPTTDVSAVNLQTVTNGSEAVLAYTFNCNAAAINGLSITVDFGGSLNGSKNVTLGEFDLRATPGVSTGLNSNPPTVEIREAAGDFAWNKRFFHTTYNNGVAPGTSSQLNAGDMQSWALSTSDFYDEEMTFPVQMRSATPVVVAYDPQSGAVGSFRDISVSASVGTPATHQISDHNVSVYDSSSALTANHNYGVHLSFDARILGA
jgi:hypothetical protein